MCVDVAGDGPGKENLLPLTATTSRDNFRKSSQLRASSQIKAISKCAVNHSDVPAHFDRSYAPPGQSIRAAKMHFSNGEPKKATTVSEIRS